MGQTPRLDEVIENAINERLESFWTAVPARVKSYDASTQTATIKINVSNKVVDGSGDKRWYKPIVHNVPVLFPGSTSVLASGGYSITYPIGKFSTGLYIVSTLPITAWRGSSNVNDDIDLSMAKGSTNRVASGFLIPAESRKPLPNVPNDAMVLSGQSILIGGHEGTQPTIMGTAYRSAEDTMLNALSAMSAALGTFAALCVGPTAPQLSALTTATAAAVTAITTFQNGFANYVTSRTEVR